ncbi:hypothetical protein B0O99DRAFT_601338 [Bisporella sp. PMI_857]|nr:hypothetical protein B0O99DRAFT_601338 [Bisporella sp. PMI_857]
MLLLETTRSPWSMPKELREPPPADPENHVVLFGVHAPLGRFPEFPEHIVQYNIRQFLGQQASADTGMPKVMTIDRFSYSTSTSGVHISWQSAFLISELSSDAIGKASGPQQGEWGATVHIDVTGIGDPLVQEIKRGAPLHSAAELRNMISNLNVGLNEHVDVYIREGENVSKIPRSTSIVQGAPLSANVSKYLNPEFAVRDLAARAADAVDGAVEKAVSVVADAGEEIAHTNPRTIAKVGGVAGAMLAEVDAVATMVGNWGVVKVMAAEVLKTTAATATGVAATVVLGGVGGAVVGHYVGHAVEEATGSKVVGAATGAALGPRLEAWYQV